MAGSFTTTGSYSNLTRLELEQLRKADFFAGGKSLTVGDSALLPEGVIGKGNINAEPYLTGPSVLLDDVYSLTPVATPGSYLGTLTQVYGTPSDTVTWYGPTRKAGGLMGVTSAVVVGTTDISNPALYGIGGTLNGLTLTLNVNGAGPLTLTLNTVTNAIDEPTFLAAIQALWIAGTLSATQGGVAGNQLVLAAPGGGSTIVVGAGTANAFLGLTPGTTGGVTNEFRDGVADFVAAGVLAGDILLIKDKTTTGFGGSNQQSVGTVTAVTATQLTLSNINSPGNFPTTQLGLDIFSYAYMVIRPGVTQLFAVPGSGPTGKEQTFLAVIPSSTLHTNLSPSLNAINADRVKSIVPSQYTHDTAIDRADGVYATPAPRVALDKLGYRIVLYPSAGVGGPDLTKPIATLNPVIDPAIPAADQRFTVDNKSGTIRFSCAPQPGSDINPNSFVNATTGRLDLYAVFWAVDQSLTAGSARELYAPRSTSVLAAPASKLYYDGHGWSGGAFTSATNTGGAFGADDILRLYDAQTVGNASPNGGQYVPLTSVTANNGDQFTRIAERGWGDIYTLIALGSNGLTLPQTDIFVGDTSAFPTQGSILVDTGSPAVRQYVQYTNKTATSFTGCTGGTGKMAIGNTVAAVAASLLKNSNARFYCSVGNGFTSFGDFNGPHALQEALAFITTPALGIQNATIFLKTGTHTIGTTLNTDPNGFDTNITIIGYGAPYGISGTGSVIMAPDVAATTIRVPSGTLTLKGIRVRASGTNNFAVHVSGTGRCWADDCTLDAVLGDVMSGTSGANASFRRCTFNGTSAEAGITIQGGNTLSCNMVTVDDSAFDMLTHTVPPIRFRAIPGVNGSAATIEGIVCTKTRFTLGTTTLGTARGLNQVFAQNTGIVDLDPAGQDSRVQTAAATTIGAPSNGAFLPQGTIFVASTATFGPPVAIGEALGTILVTTTLGVQTVTYTGRTATTFIGCTGGLGQMSTGGAVIASSQTGATIQKCYLEDCTVTTLSAFAGTADVNCLLHLVPQGNAVMGGAVGPFMQVEHFKLSGCRLTSALGNDPGAGNAQLVPFSAVNGAAHFEMDDVVFTMQPTVLFGGAVIPDDASYDYTGSPATPIGARIGMVAINCDKVTAKKIVGSGFSICSASGDLSIRTRDIDVDDIKLSSWTDMGPVVRIPVYRVIFEGYDGASPQASGGSIKHIDLNGSTITTALGHWAQTPGGIVALIGWQSWVGGAPASPHLKCSQVRIDNFLDVTGAIGGYSGVDVRGYTGSGFTLGNDQVRGVEIEDVSVTKVAYGITVNSDTVHDLWIRRCYLAGVGGSGALTGIWVKGHFLDSEGIHIEDNWAQGWTNEGIVVETDNVAGELWIGCLFLHRNTVISNNTLDTNPQIRVQAHIATAVITDAGGNSCHVAGGGVGKMRIILPGPIASPDGTLAQNLRGWQTVGSIYDYVDGARMLFNNALFKSG